MKKKVLIVTQEMKPYLIESSIAEIVRQLPAHLNRSKMEIRILMPRFGIINERRHRLHEVVRLSGINIIIDEDDYPLIIKVASLPGARLQVYFLDNEDFFKRKFVHRNKSGKFYADNTERMIFFCKGVLETVKKFGWAPDIIHCHGWMTSLIPLYVRTAYSNDPIFNNAQIIYSLYKNAFTEPLGDVFHKKARINKITAEEMAPYSDTNTGLDLGAITYADAFIKADEELDETVLGALETISDANEQAKTKPEIRVKPILERPTEENYLAVYKQFYMNLLERVTEEV